MAEKKEPSIKVTENGPYIIRGNIPVMEQVVVDDGNGEPLTWKEGERFPSGDGSALCRCGKSRSKPFCDGGHVNGFDGKETAGHTHYDEEAKVIQGPGLNLKDVPRLCSGAGFCHRLGGTWELARNSGKLDAKNAAVQQACDCPSGRLVACDPKTGKPFERDFAPSVGAIEDPAIRRSGPLWVRGGVAIESAKGKVYEKRNRVTLCRCGFSGNKPFCDGSHIDAEFYSKKK